MSVNHDFEGELEIFPAGYSSDKYAVAFTINFDFLKGHPGCRYLRNGDPGFPPEPPEANVNSVQVRVNGEKAECPDWLEKLILDAIDEDTLIEHARETMEPAI